MKVIFLDIDGVLNSHAYFLARTSAAKAAELDAAYKMGLAQSRSKEEHARDMIDPAAVEHLNALIDVSGAEVVISSSWRIAYTMGEIGRALGANGFRHRRAIIGKTPGGGGERGPQVDEWLREHPEVEAFAILDDSTDLAPHMARLVRTDWQTGLRQEHVTQALALLAQPNPTPKEP